MKINKILVNGIENAVIDCEPTVSLKLAGTVKDCTVKIVTIHIGDIKWNSTSISDISCPIVLEPFNKYEITAEVELSNGELLKEKTFFSTGKVVDQWSAKWISDNKYSFKTGSPNPFHFKYELELNKQIKSAHVAMTALGIYEFEINNRKVGDVYFAPGHTSYHNQIQYQVYNITDLLKTKNIIDVYVGGGWAVGSFNYTRVNKIYNDRQLLRAEIHIKYTDGTTEVIPTDENWKVSTKNKFEFAEWYDGEVFNGNFDQTTEVFKQANISKPRKLKDIKLQYGPQVKKMQVLKPVNKWILDSGEIIYDFGQNFAGVINAKFTAVAGDEIVFRHAEILVDNELFVKSLRTAKASATYICHDGENNYSPKMTYMGFRYVGVTGIDIDKLELEGFVLYSEMEEVGDFECSNSLLTKLQQNIKWGTKSNILEIPTDCPQRDERQGWTGDIALFSRTANYNFDMSLFYKKWLLDLRSEQAKTGGIPMVVPRSGDKWPVLPTAAWGDACILVPWNDYLTTGDINILEDNYNTIQKFIKSALAWSKLLAFNSIDKHIWKYPFQFGDWAAPTGDVKDWLNKGPEIATAYLKNTLDLAANIAMLLGHEKDSLKYQELSYQTSEAYKKKFYDGTKLKNEFQTAYVVSLYFNIFENPLERQQVAKNLHNLIVENGGNLDTGFTGTPYILFALADNGLESEAYQLLLNETCPSWLYAVKTGATTLWERWDALREDGTVNTGDLNNDKDNNESGGMVSFNHYANGAVGDFFYRRILGIEMVSAGYQTLTIKPILGGELTSAKGYTTTAYGKIMVEWEIIDSQFNLSVEIPVSSKAVVSLPNGENHAITSGCYQFSCEI